MTLGGPVGFIGSVIMIGIGGGALGPVSEYGTSGPPVLGTIIGIGPEGPATRIGIGG